MEKKDIVKYIATIVANLNTKEKFSKTYKGTQTPIQNSYIHGISN